MSEADLDPMEDAIFESSGSFTFDPEGMADKLGRYRLPGPEYYLLKLVQAAVAGGAHEIQFQIGFENSLEITMDGCPWTPEQLDDLDRAPQRHLRHLAVARHAFLALKPSQWSITHRDGRNCVRLSWGSGLGRLFSWLKFHLYWRGSRLLMQRARYAPLAIYLGDLGVNRLACAQHVPVLFSGPHHPLRLNPDVDAGSVVYVLPGDGAKGELWGCAVSLCPDVRWFRGDAWDTAGWQAVPVEETARLGNSPHLQVDCPELEISTLVYGGKPALKCTGILQHCPVTAFRWSILTIVRDGVVVESLPLQDFPSGYKYWVSSGDLNTDLSDFQVIRDDRFHRLLAGLKEWSLPGQG